MTTSWKIEKKINDTIYNKIKNAGHRRSTADFQGRENIARYCNGGSVSVYVCPDLQMDNTKSEACAVMDFVEHNKYITGGEVTIVEEAGPDTSVFLPLSFSVNLQVL